MKIRIRDRKLPISKKTKKFRPLRLKNALLKWIISFLILSNCYFIEQTYPGIFTTSWF